MFGNGAVVRNKSVSVVVRKYFFKIFNKTFLFRRNIRGPRAAENSLSDTPTCQRVFRTADEDVSHVLLEGETKS